MSKRARPASWRPVAVPGGRRRSPSSQPWADDGLRGGARRPPTTTDATDDHHRARRCTGSPGRPGVGDPYYPGLGNGGFDVEHYTLDLTWLADEGVLEGVATIEATATQDLSRFNLDLAGLEVRLGHGRRRGGASVDPRRTASS